MKFLGNFRLLLNQIVLFTNFILDVVAQAEHDLLNYATQAMQRVPGLRMIGNAPDKAAVLSFIMDGFSTEEIGSALSQEGIAVRAGHHCAQLIT